MAHKLRSATAETLTGNRTLSLAEAKFYGIWSFDPGGSGRNLTLPATADAPGEILMVTNLADAAETITVKDGSTTICTIAQNQCALLFSTGATWAGVTSYLAPPS